MQERELAARLDAGLNWDLSGLEVRDGDLVGVRSALADTVRVEVGWKGTPRLGLIRTGTFDPVETGEIRWGKGAKAGYYAQEHEGLDFQATPMELMQDTARAPDDLLRGVLGHFLLGGDQASQRVATLSGGEKTKLALARLVVSQHNLLLLDEPTNNLDIQAVEVVDSAAAIQVTVGNAPAIRLDKDPKVTPPVFRLRTAIGDRRPSAAARTRFRCLPP